MVKAKHLLFICIITSLSCPLCLNAQHATKVQRIAIILSAINGSSGKPDTFSLSSIHHCTIKWSGSDSANFKIQSLGTKSSGQQKWQALFQPQTHLPGVSRAGVQFIGSSGQLVAAISFTGLVTKGLEGENEAPLSSVVDALGFHIQVGWNGLANHSRPELQGDELPFQLFQKTGKGNVEMQPVARYSPDFELPFGYYINTANGPDKKQAGVLSKAGKYPEHQTLFPAIVSGSAYFNPGNQTFGFYATGPTHSAYSEDVWNMLLHPANAVRAIRIYPVKDLSNKTLNNTYLLCFEEAKNGDYNDYVFLVKNIKPVTTNLFTPIFNGVNLKGWHTYINGQGKNNDPENNFAIEDSTLHVAGRGLGYVMSDESFHNYQLKAQFKWGEKKWPPRENAKRDAGICYNIPVNEPDSIWPVSIECQVQEGDVGDFWLLGFSTINVDGKINKPSSHAQIVKKQDGEKPKGDWNTVEIISYNGRCVHIVNGVVVNYGIDASVKDGRILLQSEYAEVYYRDVEVRKL